MWNSPSGSKDGKRYELEEIRVLAHPLANLLETLQFMQVKDSMDEQILHQMEKPELIYAIYVAAWNSYERLCATIDPAGNKSFDLFPDLELDLANPRVYESPDITEEMWQDILIGDGGLWGEFLWDNDWRMSGLLDLPKRTAKSIADRTGIDLEVVHRLAPTPSEAELTMAEYYIKYVIWNDEVIDLRQKRGT